MPFPLTDGFADAPLVPADVPESVITLPGEVPNAMPVGWFHGDRDVISPEPDFCDLHFCAEAACRMLPAVCRNFRISDADPCPPVT